MPIDIIQNIEKGVFAKYRYHAIILDGCREISGCVTHATDF